LDIVGDETLRAQLPKRQGRKHLPRDESDSDTQIALRLARLRRDVLELQEESEEDLPEEHKEEDDALNRLRSFRESLGIPAPEPLMPCPPKSKKNHKRRHQTTGRYPRKKEFEDSPELSETQLLERLQQLRESLMSPERSKGSKLQRESRKKRIRPRANKFSDRNPGNYGVSEDLHPIGVEHPHAQAANNLHLEGVHLGVAKELQNQCWAMDLNNVMQMEFGIEGGQVDQFGGSGCGHLGQYAQ